MGAKNINIREGESNELRLSNIPKGEKAIATIIFNKDGYTEHCKDYNSYQEWLNNRNTQRYVDVKNHGQKIDGKNMLHCIRLLEVALEIGEGKGLNVRRNNAEYLLSIRRGELNLEELIAKADSIIDGLDQTYKNSGLPDKVDAKMVNDMLVSIRAKAYGDKNLSKILVDKLNHLKADRSDILKPKLGKKNINEERLVELNKSIESIETLLKSIKKNG